MLQSVQRALKNPKRRGIRSVVFNAVMHYGHNVLKSESTDHHQWVRTPASDQQHLDPSPNPNPNPNPNLNPNPNPNPNTFEVAPPVPDAASAAASASAAAAAAAATDADDETLAAGGDGEARPGGGCLASL